MTQCSVKVSVCTICPDMPVAGIWLPAGTNAVAWRQATTWEHRTIGTSRDFDGALPELQIILVCAPQRMDTEIPAAALSGGRGTRRKGPSS
jgi:hypothetical protein